MVDGAARGNPGEAGCGAVIFDEAGEVRKELCRYLGRATNNVAEYEALIMGLEAVLRLGGTRILIQSDSELMVRQLNGLYRVKDEKLVRLYRKAVALLKRFESSRILHVVREHNRIADRLANQAIDAAARGQKAQGFGCFKRSG
ncbi:MAG: ribonuclease HI family protein [Deltaproteobacteria bacterium]|nr:ribonuclease HI family protein [Deltaproteobacteria bacterium]